MKTIEQIVERLTATEQTVAIAESCTRGMVAAAFVSLAGVSVCFKEGYVTYSNEAKEKNLGVLHETLEQYGAVSRQTATEMAAGVRDRADADYGIATTGIAGPDGGTKDKPVGLVYVACATTSDTFVQECRFAGDRQAVRQQAVEAVTNLLLSCMSQEGE